jgi:hypothetical protein
MRPPYTQVAAIIAGGVMLHALWDAGRVTNHAAEVDHVREGLAEQVEHAIQSIRSIRVDSNSPPWVMMHALQAFGPDFEMVDAKMNKPMRILAWICGPGSAEFFQTVNRGSCADHCISVAVQGYSECHPDQWFCILSAYSVPFGILGTP